MDIESYIRCKAESAKRAAYSLQVLPSSVKDGALLKMADVLEKRSRLVLQENTVDLEIARKNGLRRSYLDRLMLDESRIRSMAEGLRMTAALPDPVGSSDYSVRRPNGLDIRRVRVPIGVIGIVYEARPNVTSDAAALCLKSGNAVILRGGSDALHTNTVIAELLNEAALKSGIPDGAIQFINRTEHEGVEILSHMDNLVDLIIPRGGRNLIEAVKKCSTVPVIQTGTGVCHTFVDESADQDMAIRIAVNAKTSHPSVCNAMETLLVHEAIAEAFLPKLEQAMMEKHVELRGCEKCCAICPDMKQASLDDWSTEYGDLILSVKVVDGIGEAIEHINRYNTGHSETIVTQNLINAHRFQREVDAAAVYVNASTRFTDGGEFGFGAEIGISTQKLHARGPMGLRELTTTKYLIYGEGQVR